MLASAVRLQRAVAEQGRILRPGQLRLSGSQVLARLAPALQGFGESARFDRALADYRQVVDRCELQPALNRVGRTGRHGGEDDQVGAVVPSGGVELPAAGH
jgi:hypothetical protein